MSSWEVVTGDSLRVLADLEAESVDAIVCDPPYGLEFMGREWDRFREDDQRVPGYNGRGAGALGELADRDGDTLGGRLRVGVGGGSRPSTSRCEGCGKRDQFRKPHGCPDGTNWRAELIDPHAAPPSSLAFQSWCREWARLAYRALKPGGHLLAFGGTRTYHRMAAGVEDAGFEVRDQLQWLYGQGFPKSLDVSKAIDAAAGATREVVGPGRWNHVKGDNAQQADCLIRPGGQHAETAPATPDAERWQGWGTALKPAHEPIVLARKPLTSSVAANVLTHGTGALNVDGCRVVGDMSSARYGGRHLTRPGDGGTMGEGWREGFRTSEHEGGRWPANVLMDPEAAAILDAQTGDLPTQATRNAPGRNGDGGMFGLTADGERSHPGPGESGGASRFLYCAKASQAERNALELSYLPRARSARKRRHQDLAGSWRGRARNRHPTVKPVDVMRWLVRLVTPPGGLVVDPFAGSGTTGCAAALEGFRFVGIERDVGSAIVARARIAWWARHPDGMELVRRRELEAAREALADAGQLDLFAVNGGGS